MLAARYGLLLAGAMLVPLSGVAETGGSPVRVVVGAKKLTEGAVLAELMAQVIESCSEAQVERRFNLAGTQVAFDALRGGGIDVYPEYTGTILRNMLGYDGSATHRARVLARVSRALRRDYGLVTLAPFGFNNTYAMIMRRRHARALGVTRISDLAGRSLRFGVSHEFGRRADGLPGLRRVYGLDIPRPMLLEHDLAYRALADEAIDISDGYSTDAKLAGEDLLVLVDDKGFFPPYEAVPLLREDLLQRLPEVASGLALLAGRIDDATMRRLNHEVEVGRESPRAVASRFLRQLGVGSSALERSSRRAASFWSLLWQRRWITLELSGQHLILTGLALLAACLLGVPLGIAVSRRPRPASVVLGVAGVLQTIPSIALLAFMLPLFGIGVKPAVVALFLYGLLPILRNTVTGLRSVEPGTREVGRGLGMTTWQLLRRVELPLAAPVILAGVRTAAVISVGTATLAAFIGAGGLGQPIVTGLSMSDFALVLCGALPAALLALSIDAALAGVEWLATPRGLRIEARAATVRR